jgi:hypothetical protein
VRKNAPSLNLPVFQPWLSTAVFAPSDSPAGASAEPAPLAVVFGITVSIEGLLGNMRRKLFCLDVCT